MAASSQLHADPLLALRAAVAAKREPVPTTSAEPPLTLEDATPAPLSEATHLHFLLSAPSSPTAVSSPTEASPHPVAETFALTTPTRFVSSSAAAATASSSPQSVDLRSIFFAWQKKDDAIPDYIASATALNEALAAPGGAGGKVQNLVFVERLDLITWLEGASSESEYIKPLNEDGVGDGSAAGGAGIGTVNGDIGAGSGADAAVGAGVIAGVGAGAARPAKTIDPRLQEIYNGERRMGDRNSILRGYKATDFSSVRKVAEQHYLRRVKQKNASQGSGSGAGSGSGSGPGAGAGAISKPSSRLQNPASSGLSLKAGGGQMSSSLKRRPDPIILLSPSASSLLRISNIKPFLETGAYAKPTTATPLSLLHTSRTLSSISPGHATRFILTDDPALFKPDYWARVVCVFTTGQAWQFKQYRWTEPQDLFKHVLGVYVGWRGDQVPETVRGWGRGVSVVEVDKVVPGQTAEQRWRDREVSERIWRAIEDWMRGRGWGREGPRV